MSNIKGFIGKQIRMIVKESVKERNQMFLSSI